MEQLNKTPYFHFIDSSEAYASHVACQKSQYHPAQLPKELLRNVSSSLHTS